MTVHGLLNGWLPDRAAASRRLAEVTAQLERLDREGHATYNVKAVNAFLAGDVAAMLQVTSAWVERHRTPWAMGAHGFALLVNGRFDDSAQVLEMALRLSPRDTLRADWQYRLAMAHFGAGRLSLAHEWARAAALTNPGANLWHDTASSRRSSCAGGFRGTSRGSREHANGSNRRLRQRARTGPGAELRHQRQG